jgi:hypothetical protein
MAQDVEREVLRTGPRGWGIDATGATRPGVPREWEGAGSGGLDGSAPALEREVLLLDRDGAPYVTPVVGSGPRPRLLSGALRRLAYRLPEHRGSRWALLLGADRVDVAEHRLGAALWVLPAAAALALGYAAVSRLLGD